MRHGKMFSERLQERSFTPRYLTFEEVGRQKDEEIRLEYISPPCALSVRIIHLRNLLRGLSNFISCLNTLISRSCRDQNNDIFLIERNGEANEKCAQDNASRNSQSVCA